MDGRSGFAAPAQWTANLGEAMIDATLRSMGLCPVDIEGRGRRAKGSLSSLRLSIGRERPFAANRAAISVAFLLKTMRLIASINTYMACDCLVGVGKVLQKKAYQQMLWTRDQLSARDDHQGRGGALGLPASRTAAVMSGS